MPNIRVDYTPNTGPEMTEVHVFISRDAEGKENALGGYLPGLGLTQFMTGNPKTLAKFHAIVKEVLPQLQAEGQTVHLLKFTHREEVKL